VLIFIKNHMLRQLKLYCARSWPLQREMSWYVMQGHDLYHVYIIQDNVYIKLLMTTVSL